MAKCLFTTKDRNASHAKLEDILKKDPSSRAECRDGDGEYTVWDGPMEREISPAPPPPPAPTDDDAMMDALADRIATKLAAKLAAKDG